MGEPGAYEAPYVALLIKGIHTHLGELTGARHAAPPLDTRQEPCKQSLVREK